MVLNSANYFTSEVLDNHSGPSHLPNTDRFFSGDKIGEALFIPLGTLVCMSIKWLYWLYDECKTESNCYKAFILHGFCNARCSA
jgi:antigen polymerase